MATRPHGQGQSQTRHEQGGNLRITSESATRYLIDRSVIIFWVVIYICVNESCFTFDCWQILTDRYMSKQKRSAAAAASGDLAFPLRSFLAFLVNNTMYAYTCFLIAFVAYISIEDDFFVSGCYIIIFLIQALTTRTSLKKTAASSGFLVRVHTKVGTWRLPGVRARATIGDLKKIIEQAKGACTDERTDLLVIARGDRKECILFFISMGIN